MRCQCSSACVYDSVLLPTDGSEGTERATEHAIDLAVTYDAALHTFYIVENAYLTGPTGDSTLIEEFEIHGQEAIDTVIERAEEANVPTVEEVVANGCPHRSILDYADENDIDLITMGTHGRGGIEHYLIGSVAEKVVRLSDAPVLTVRLHEDKRDD